MFVGGVCVGGGGVLRWEKLVKCMGMLIFLASLNWFSHVLGTTTFC